MWIPLGFTPLHKNHSHVSLNSTLRYQFWSFWGSNRFYSHTFFSLDQFLSSILDFIFAWMPFLDFSIICHLWRLQIFKTIKSWLLANSLSLNLSLSFACFYKQQEKKKAGNIFNMLVKVSSDHPVLLSTLIANSRVDKPCHYITRTLFLPVSNKVFPHFFLKPSPALKSSKFLTNLLFMQALDKLQASQLRLKELNKLRLQRLPISREAEFGD